MFSHLRAVPNSTTKMNCFQSNLSALSRPLVPLQLPSPMETHFWYMVPDEINSVSLLNQYTDLLSPCEKQRVLSMGDHRLQKSALLARTLVRTTIARYQINHHDDPRSLKFRKNIHGKPEVEWEGGGDGWCPPPLHFNISHTSSLIACGVTMNSLIGIDVEDKQRKLKNSILAFARRYFTSAEVEYLSAISDTEIQRQEFVKLWTLKEAYVKALGRGFSGAPFKTFTIHMKKAIKGGFNNVHEEPEIIVESADDPKKCKSKWRFALMELAGSHSHYAAVCLEKDKGSEAGTDAPIRMAVRKTVPFVEDVCVSETDAVVPIAGSLNQTNS